MKPALPDLAISGAMILLMSCGRSTQHDYYDFDFQKPPDVRQLIWRSSIIVLGTVAGVRTIREGIPAGKQPELLLDQMRVDVAVENVLLGNLDRPRMTIEFFGYSKGNPGGYTGPPPLVILPGERRMFFLTQDFGVYRSVGDVRDSNTLMVWSGLHKSVRPLGDPQQPRGEFGTTGTRRLGMP
jgi:hypothetical protein